MTVTRRNRLIPWPPVHNARALEYEQPALIYTTHVFPATYQEGAVI